MSDSLKDWDKKLAEKNIALAKRNAKIEELTESAANFEMAWFYEKQRAEKAEDEIRQLHLVLDPDNNFGTELIARAEKAEKERDELRLQIETCREHSRALVDERRAAEARFADEHAQCKIEYDKRVAAELREKKLVEKLEEIAGNDCCGNFVGGCPRNHYDGDRRKYCPVSKAINALAANAEAKEKS